MIPVIRCVAAPSNRAGLVLSRPQLAVAVDLRVES